MCMNYKEDSDMDECDNPNCSLRNTEDWKFSIKEHTSGHAGRIVIEGIGSVEGFLDCKLRRMRLMNIYHMVSIRAGRFTAEYLTKWSNDEVTENCQRVNDLIEVLKSQWNEFRCTLLLEQEKLVLDRVYDNIARYHLTSFAEGCPLTFDHGINIENLLISTQIDRVVI
ncbi:Protein CBG26352 [Caenorhabditis briggsae]|uniref:Protein CBG26352 n=1 Tax=Caenorhabditis briggsae TaxID=6238 RepID=B6IGC3_CAEBR|nr:Protein CBG26352 [Caenorhabditis briggsae]CAR98953.1 Protein CBG26352 [Caenorhabditis briggsae]